MKKIISIAVLPVVLFSLFLLSACGPRADEGDDVASTVVENEFFKIEVPAGWTETEPVPGIIKMFSSDSESGDARASLMGFKDSFSIALDSKTILGEDYMAGMKETLTQIIPDATYSGDKCFKVDGRDACSVVMDTIQNEVHLKLHMVGVEGYGSDIWIVTLTTTETDYDSSLVALEEMLDTFELYSAQ